MFDLSIQESKQSFGLQGLGSCTFLHSLLGLWTTGAVSCISRESLGLSLGLQPSIWSAMYYNIEVILHYMLNYLSEDWNMSKC